MRLIVLGLPRLSPLPGSTLERLVRCTHCYPMAATPFLTTVGGTATSFIPLPTPWTSANTDCAEAIYRQIGGSFLAWDPWYVHYINGDLTTCWPPQASSWWNQDASPTTSIGTTFVCPAAYHEAYTSSADSHTTQTICCPSGYDLYVADFAKPSFPSQCTSTMTTGETLSWEQIVYVSDKDGDTWTAATTTVQTETLTIYGLPINGFNIITTSTSSSSSGVSTGIASSTSMTTTSLSSTSAGSSSSSGSSVVGVAVGASVGAVVGVLLVAVGAFLFWRRRRGRAGLETQTGGHTGLNSWEYDLSKSAGLTQTRPMLGYYSSDGQQPMELRGSPPNAQELPAGEHINAHELPVGRDERLY